MFSPWTRRLSFTCLVIFAACACSRHGATIPSAQAAPAPPAKPGAEKAESPTEDGQSLPPGIDIGKMGEFERKVFFRVANKEPSACGKGHSLLHSAKHDNACRASFYALRYVAHLVNSGFTDSEISEKLERRFRLPRHPQIDVSAAPSKGSQSGRVIVVEFVDYECPHCRHAQSLIKQAVEEFPNEVKVFYKHFPLSAHANARLAVEGAVAAQRQGKFWPFSDKVWLNSDGLTPAVLEKIAKEIGLDVAKWRADLGSAAVKDRVAKDRSEGDDLGINATPTIYINGRKYDDPLEIASFRDWINEELGR
jgi:thiol-disulfide isomerase/thioredoxin